MKKVINEVNPLSNSNKWNSICYFDFSMLFFKSLRIGCLMVLKYYSSRIKMA